MLYAWINNTFSVIREKEIIILDNTFLYLSQNYINNE